MDSDHAFSRTLSRTLDHLGYSSDMVKHRVHMYREEAKYYSTECIITGSKGEGLTAPYESDKDIMEVQTDLLVCGDDTFNLDREYPNNLVLKTERHSTPPGYTFLKMSVPFEIPGEFYNVYKYLLFENGDLYLSNDMFEAKEINSFQQLKNEIESHQRGFMFPFSMEARSGPSMPITDIEGTKDHVKCFICFCPNLLHSWKTRQRYNNWPTLETIQEISRLEAHVVPVGFKVSANKKYEWRICFTKAELCLMYSMNDTQTKLYILLKMVAKQIIQPFQDTHGACIFKDITSYVMKNIVLWMAELYPRELFTEELLTDRLIQSLQFLKHCVTNNFLPNYMIPSRNLLAGQLDAQKRQLLSNQLTCLIKDRKVQFILLNRWPKLKTGLYMMYTMIENISSYGEWREKVERCHLLRNSTLRNISLKLAFLHSQFEANTVEILYQIMPIRFPEHDILDDIMRTMVRLLVPDLIELRLSGMDSDSKKLYTYNERERTALS